MSRNGSGVYSLPVPPFTPGTVILSADVNSDFSDIATALTASIAADGQTPITGQLRGSQASAPAYSITGDINTGFGSSSADTAYIQCGGVNTLACTTLGATITGTAAITGTLIVTGDTTFGNVTTPFRVLSTDAGAGIGPQLDLFRDSASPLASDLIGSIDFNGRDSVAAKTLYARIISTITDPTDGSEDAILSLQARVAGAFVDVLQSSGADISIPGALVVTGTLTGSGAISGASVTGTMIATQADQETSTSTTTVVSPGRQQFHPSAAKWWLESIVTGGTPAQTVSYNVTSITDTGVGRLTVTIATDFSSANWVCVGSVMQSGGAALRALQLASQAAGSVEVNCFGTANTLVDPEVWHVAGFGDQ